MLSLDDAARFNTPLEPREIFLLSLFVSIVSIGVMSFALIARPVLQP